VRRLAVLVLATAVLVAACARDDGARPSQNAGSLLPADRLALPQYDLEQYRALIAELAGTPVVVNVWGSWCPPCREEAPVLADVAEDNQGRVQFLGIDILDDRPSAREFIREYDWPYPSIFDPQGAIRDGLGYVGQPVTLIYDRQGDLVFEWQGTITEDLLRREIGKVL
jgi:cytochrome c biogenesis protein CcmG, thiol:disulfide interchange protein DsbE